MNKKEYTTEEKIKFFEEQLVLVQARLILTTHNLEKRERFLENKLKELKASLPKVDPPA